MRRIEDNDVTACRRCGETHGESASRGPSGLLSAATLQWACILAETALALAQEGSHGQNDEPNDDVRPRMITEPAPERKRGGHA